MAWKFFTSAGRLLTSGQPGPAGSDGAAGAAGANGSNGTNGVGIIKEGGAVVSSVITTLDFGVGFDVVESPAGEANVDLDASEVSGAPVTQALGDSAVTGTSASFSNANHKHALTRPVIDALSDVDTTSTPPATGDSMVFDGANWVPDGALGTGGSGLHPPGGPLYGDGSDGVIDLDGTNVYTTQGFHTNTTGWFITGGITKAYDLTRDVFCTTLRVRSGVYLATAGYRIFARTVTVDSGGVIGCRGGIGASATPNASGVNGGTGSGQGTLSGSQNAPNGRTNSAGVGPAGTNLSNCAYGLTTGAGSGKGGQGGAGGANAGGTVGTIGVISDILGGIGNMRHEVGAVNFHNTAGTILNPGTAGTGGGTSSSTATTVSGGGGAPGGVIIIVAMQITNSGSITVAGGDGAAGVQAGSGGAAGGGGGGGGGVVIFVTRLFSGTAPVVTGGNGAAGANGGGTGSNGSDGVAYTVDGPW